MTAGISSVYRSFISVSVIIPYLSRKEHLRQSLPHWFEQDYRGGAVVTVVDFSGQPSDLDMTRVKLVRPSDTRWNISRARNLGARMSFSDLLIFAPADALVVPEFISDIASQWNEHDAWIAESIYRGVPSDPALSGLIAVKRWVNTRLRGFNEPMMENPHGWGYDAIDYRLRLLDMLRSCGGSVGTYPLGSTMLLTNTEEMRVEPYDVKDMEASLHAHIQYSLACRQQYGWVANYGQPWGQP